MAQLIDSYNRHINYLRISVTDRCNLRCSYCMPKDGIALLSHEDILRYEEMIRIARVAVSKGVSKIRITGGEPLARKGIVAFMASLAHMQGVGDLSMTTNGVLLYDNALPLRRAGLKRLNISLDSLQHEKYKKITRGGDIKRVWAGLEKAREAGFAPIKINVVVVKGINDDEIMDFARLAVQRAVHVRFIEYMPIGRENGWQANRFISSAEIQQMVETLGPLIAVPSGNGSGPAKMFTLPGAKGKLGFISSLSNHFCSNCNRLRLTPDGKLRTCLFSDKEIDLKTLLREGCTDAALKEIITAAILTKPKKHTASEPFFKKCSRGMFAIGG